MGVFFDVSPWFSDPFLLGVDLNDVTSVSKETDEHHTSILLSYASSPLLFCLHILFFLLADLTPLHIQLHHEAHAEIHNLHVRRLADHAPVLRSSHLVRRRDAHRRLRQPVQAVQANHEIQLPLHAERPAQAGDG